MLSGHEPEPGSKLTTVLKCASIRDCGDNCCRRNWSNPFDCADPLTLLALAERLNNSLVKIANTHFDLDEALGKAL